MSRFPSLSLACLMIVTASSCRVESDKLPTANISYGPEEVQKARKEIALRLRDLTTATSVVNRMQNMLNRSLDQKGIVSGTTSPNISAVLEPTETDELVMNEGDHDHFTYILNNSATYAMTTHTGGQVSFILEGELFRHGDALDINNIKLDVLHITASGKEKFHILAETKLDQSGQRSSNWSIDFTQLNSFYNAAGVEPANSFQLEGVLSVAISARQTDISATKFRQRSGEVEVVFDHLELHFNNDPFEIKDMNVAGRVEQKRDQVGTFAIESDASNSQHGFSIKLDLGR